MSELSPTTSLCGDKLSEIKSTSNQDRKRKLSVEFCEVFPTKKPVIVIDLEDSHSDSEKNENGDKTILPSESVIEANAPTENLVESAILHDQPNSTSDTVSVEISAEGIAEDTLNGKSIKNLKQESTSLTDEVNEKPSVILKIRADYASDGELEDSPLPDLPETSPISDGPEMSPITHNFNEEDDPTKITKSQTPEKSGENSCDASQRSEGNDPNKELPEDKSLLQFSDPVKSEKSVPNLNQKPKGIQLVNFQMQEYVLPDTERFGSCRLITEFQKLSIVGEGSFGVVYKVIDKKNQNRILALKKLKFKRRKNETLPIQAMREINILKNLEHPNLVNSHGVAVGSNFNNTYLILDFCEYDLSKIIDDEKSSVMLQEKEIKCIMLQLFEGLRHMHSNYILHRDLSCSNVLFTSHGVLKIGDFGSSRSIMINTPMTPNVVSRWYRAPELLLGETHYTPAIDVWSSGCIFAETLIKKPLLKADSDMKMIAAIIDLLGTPNERIWPGISQLPVLQQYDLIEQPENRLRSRFRDLPEEGFILLEQLLTYDPQKRITADHALHHVYFLAQPKACHPEGLIPILRVADEIVRLRGR